MIAPARKREPRTWDPDSRAGEDSNSHGKRRKRDIWFFIGILVFAVLLFFVWQQRQRLVLADEIARLEERRSSLRALVLESWSTAARLKQLDSVFDTEVASGKERWELEQHSFVFIAPATDEPRLPPRGQILLASVGLDIPEAAAAGRR